MATKIFRGDYPATADVYTFVVGGTVEAGDLFLTTINGKSVSVAAPDTTTTATATAIQTALAASAIAEFTEATWTVNSSTVTATGQASGDPITITGSTTEAGGGAADAQTYVTTHATTATNPNDWSIAANWSASGVPSGDTVFVQTSSVNILNGLAQGAISLTALNILASYTGEIGRPVYSESGGYYEYRNTYLTFNDVTTLNVGFGPGSGSSRLKIDTGSNAICTANIYKTGQRKEEGVPALLWKGGHASNVFNLFRGDVGIAFLPGETAVIATLNIGFIDNPSSDAAIWCGSGTTLTTVAKIAGTLTMNAGCTTFTQSGGDDNLGNGGDTTIWAGSVTTMTVDKGNMFWNSSGTITTLKLGQDAIFDASEAKAATTVTNCTMEPGAKLLDPKNKIVHTNPLVINGPLSSVTIDKGSRANVQFS